MNSPEYSKDAEKWIAGVNSTDLDPYRQALVRRVCASSLEVVSTLSPGEVADLLEAPDRITLFRRLVDALPEHESVLNAARNRGKAVRSRILHDEGGTYASDEVAARLGVTRQAVNRRIRVGTLLALDIGRHGRRIPVWQFTEQGELQGLREVLEHLPKGDAWGNAHFFLASNADLEGARPLDALRSGRVEQVVALAKRHAQHGAQ